MVTTETRSVVVAEEYITLSEAAHRAGYLSTSALRMAAADKRLKTVRFGPRAIVTTPSWLDEYLANLRFNTQFRGRPKGASDAAADA